jgi:hypothetical protein
MTTTEVSPQRLELALKMLRPTDWERFERLASAFLASEWPEIRTVAAAGGGDDGRDAELFSPSGATNVVIQYSVRVDWVAKINQTVVRLKKTMPDSKILVYVSNQTIGAKADESKKELLEQGIFLDVRDQSWFLERLNTDSNRTAAATELARVIVDPFLESKGIISSGTSALSGQEARELSPNLGDGRGQAAAV